MSKGETIKLLRKQKNMTQDQLANKLGTSKRTIFKYENDIIINIPTDKVELLAETFNVTPAYIMGWNADSQKHGDGLDLETSEIAHEVSNRPELKLLFEASRSVSTDDLKLIIDMANRLRKTEEK